MSTGQPEPVATPDGNAAGSDATRSISTDLVLSPFAADGAELVEIAGLADRLGFDGVWTLDHFSGSMLGRPWSRDPFTLLGGFAAATTRVRVGPLVANMVNRHPAQLASAASTLQSMAGGRAVLGIGSGAAPGSRFAGEQTAIGRELTHAAGRRRHLIETIESVRLIWAGGGDYDGEFVQMRGLDGVVGPEPIVPIIVGASGRTTTELACEHADGLNLRVTPETEDLVTWARAATNGRQFEISIHDDLDVDHPLGGEVDRWVELGVDRRTLVVKQPVDRASLESIATRLAAL